MSGSGRRPRDPARAEPTSSRQAPRHTRGIAARRAPSRSVFRGTATDGRMRHRLVSVLRTPYLLGSAAHVGFLSDRSFSLTSATAAVKPVIARTKGGTTVLHRWDESRAP